MYNITHNDDKLNAPINKNLLKFQGINAPINENLLKFQGYKIKYYRARYGSTGI